MSMECCEAMMCHLCMFCCFVAKYYNSHSGQNDQLQKDSFKKSDENRIDSDLAISAQKWSKIAPQFFLGGPRKPSVGVNDVWQVPCNLQQVTPEYI